MALSRIWSAFVLTAIIVAGIKCFFFGQLDIFNWMVVGRASDPANPLKMDGILAVSYTHLTLPTNREV